MKDTMKAMLIFAAISLWLCAMGGCDKKKDSEEVHSTGNGIEGKYYNKDDHEEYIELKADSTVFVREMSSGTYHEQAGEWKVYGREIAVISVLGDVERGQIEDAKILMGGKVWVKHMEPREATNHGIPGNYILEEKHGEEMKRKDGIIVFKEDRTIRGAGLKKWKIENGLIQLYTEEGSQIGYNGKIEGDDIVFYYIREDGKRDIAARFIKQDGEGQSKTNKPKITSKSRETSGVYTIPEDEIQWVKCNNKSCNAEYKMSKRDYYKALEENPNLNPMATGPVAITCKECGKQSVFAAVKCPNCEKVFIEGSGATKPGDYSDRCPHCGISEVEERMKSRTGGR
jgi:hypothetical protein